MLILCYQKRTDNSRLCCYRCSALYRTSPARLPVLHPALASWCASLLDCLQLRTVPPLDWHGLPSRILVRQWLQWTFVEVAQVFRSCLLQGVLALCVRAFRSDSLEWVSQFGWNRLSRGLEAHDKHDQAQDCCWGWQVALVPQTFLPSIYVVLTCLIYAGFNITRDCIRTSGGNIAALGLFVTFEVPTSENNFFQVFDRIIDKDYVLTDSIQTCLRLCRLIKLDSKLQYILELNIYRLQENNISGPYSERLAYLRRYRQKWECLDFSKAVSVPTDPTSMAYDFAEGIYSQLMQSGDVVIHQIPSALDPSFVVQRRNIFRDTNRTFGTPDTSSPKDFAVDPSQNLIIWYERISQWASFLVSLCINSINIVQGVF